MDNVNTNGDVSNTLILQIRSRNNILDVRGDSIDIVKLKYIHKR